MLSTVVLWCHAYSRFGMAPGRIDVVRMRILLSVMTRLFFWWLVPRACVCGRCRVSRLRHIKGAISVPRWWRRAAPRARRDTGPLHAGGAQGGGRREASTGQKDAASSGGRGGEPRARGGPCPRRAPAVRRGVGPMPGSPWQGAVCSQGTLWSGRGHSGPRAQGLAPQPTPRGQGIGTLSQAPQTVTSTATLPCNGAIRASTRAGRCWDYGSTPVQWPGSFTCHSNPEKLPYACQTSARHVQR